MTLSVGQKVIVVKGWKRVDLQDGEITRVGRTLVDIKISDGSFPYEFRIKEQNTNDGVGFWHFYTEAQWAERLRRAEALKVIHDFGLEPRSGAQPDTRHLVDLADQIRRF